MNLTISGDHLPLTLPLREYVSKKLQRVVRHLGPVVAVKVRLSVDNNLKQKQLRQRAQCNVHMKGREIYAESSHEDLYAAVGDLAMKLDCQAARYKRKIQEFKPSEPKRHAYSV